MNLLERSRRVYNERGTRALFHSSLRFLVNQISDYVRPDEPIVKRIGHATSSDLQHWERDSANPVFTPSDSPAWDSQIVEDPTALVQEGEIYLMYAGTDVDNLNVNHIGRARSLDGTTWSRDPPVPVFSPGHSDSWDSRSVHNPDVAVMEDTVHLVYGGSNDEAAWIGFGHATSSDLTKWEDRSEGPFLTAGPNGAWDDTYVADPCLVFDPDTRTAHLFYAGYDGAHWQIGHAVSSDLDSWEKDPNNPVITYDHNPDWNYRHVGDPTVMYVDGSFHMVHIANTGEVKRLLQARSEDLSTWESLSTPALEPKPAGTWEDERITNPALFEFRGTYHLLYVGVEGKY